MSENKNQRKIQALIIYYCRGISKDPETNLYNFSDLDKDIVQALEAVKRQYADNPAKNYQMTAEEKELGFTINNGSISGCCTVPCFGGKMPYQSEPTVGCAIGQTMCDQSPVQCMREARVFEKAEAELKEKKRLAKNKRARELHAGRKG